MNILQALGGQLKAESGSYLSQDQRNTLMQSLVFNTNVAMQAGNFPTTTPLSLTPSSSTKAVSYRGARSIPPLSPALDPHRGIISDNKHPLFFKTSGMHWAGKIQQAGISLIGRSAQCYLGQI